ncbi:MAG: hypothetical protein IPP71_08080 [Bacteroidetes bacterium]|nr:hypothetical protein [Bacteroidota bacterium]
MLKMLEFGEEDMDDVSDIEYIPIYDFIGRPDFVHEKDLSDQQILIELHRVEDLLFENKIIYSVLSRIEARELYKFVTEELFQHPIANIPDSEIGSHYFYEDFHPDNEFDTRIKCKEFIAIFFSRDFAIRIRDYYMEEIRNLVDLFDFHDAIEEFRNVEFEILNTAITPGECIRKATISFEAVSSVGIKPIHYSGEAIFELDYCNDQWVVMSATFPGMPEWK